MLCAIRNAIELNVAQNANNQSMLNVVNLLKELKVMSIRCGISVVAFTLGLNHCEKVVYHQEGAGQTDQKDGNSNKQEVPYIRCGRKYSFTSSRI